ncbi:hypothetical protein ACGF13_40245 [Kitasatospora sp. NPDC048286]|uniref:hypothetical protein n=1 Tax=Kitasatospora sp. NPDC048286 TaxID=3364047 RepID=UPI0037141C67
MAEVWDERQLAADGFEHVYAELDWYDGPRSGLVGIGGVPHYFQCHDVDFSVAPDEYFVWPADEKLVALEREQWAVFVEWNQRYEEGVAGIDRHPGQGGVDARYDELTALLTPYRQAPAGAKLLVAEWRYDGGSRYRADGVDYWVRWREGRDDQA